MQSLKKLAKRKAKAELAEIKARAKELKNPFSKFLDVLDKAPKIFDLALNLGLAYASFKTFGVSEVMVRDTIQVPHEYWTTPEEFQVYEFATPLEEYGKPIGERTFPKKEPSVKKVYYTTESRERKVTVYNPFAALVGPIGLKLAQSDNLISGAVGCSMLSAVGIKAGVDWLSSAAGQKAVAQYGVGIIQNILSGEWNLGALVP